MDVLSLPIPIGKHEVGRISIQLKDQNRLEYYCYYYSSSYFRHDHYRSISLVFSGMAAILWLLLLKISLDDQAVESSKRKQTGWDLSLHSLTITASCVMVETSLGKHLLRRSWVFQLPSVHF